MHNMQSVYRFFEIAYVLDIAYRMSQRWNCHSY